MAFGYTAKPTNVIVDYKCANDVRIKWSGNGNAAGTVFRVTMGTTYTSVTNTISNFVTSGSAVNGNLITWNDYTLTITQLQALLNVNNGSTVYVQIKAHNNSTSCTSDPSTTTNFIVYNSPFRTSISFNTICSGEGVYVNSFNYDACIEKCSLEVVNLNNPSEFWIGQEENVLAFANRLNAPFNSNLPFGENYTNGSIQNYINQTRPSFSQNPFYYGYNGVNNVSVGNLFKSFKGVQGSYRVRFIYKIIGGGYSFVDYIITVNSPSYTVTLKRDDGSFRPSDQYDVPEIQGYNSKTIRIYSNRKKLSAFINPFYPTTQYAQNCVHSIAIDFSNTLAGFPAYGTLFGSNPINGGTLNSADLAAFLGSGLDLDNYSAVWGAQNMAFIRITYTSADLGRGTFSAIYNFDASNRTRANYIKSNIAYETEKNIGYNNFMLEHDLTSFYTYDHNNHFYYSGSNILIPDNNSTVVSNSSFYGFSGGTPSPTNFQWDNVSLDPSHRGPEYDNQWDKVNLFVSPMSQSMTICDAVNISNVGNPCTLSTVLNIVNPVYNSNPNPIGNYVNAGTRQFQNLLMDQGSVDGGSDNEFILQQTNSNNAYCVNTYGNGWRLPTATEIGKENDLPFMFTITNPAYFENSTGFIWTSNFWNNNTSNWDALGSAGGVNLNLNNTYLTQSNYVRCVYSHQ